MSFPTDWDIEKYRVGYESEEHWELRKKFLLKHKNKYPEEKLVCLTQVFYNVEFLGCRYPKDTMKMVETLSHGIVEDHREKMKGRLKRTFVEASDAASSKVKGLPRSAAAASLDNGVRSSKSILSIPGTSTQKPSLSNLIKFEAAQQSPDKTQADEPVTAKKKRKKKKKGGSEISPLPATNPISIPVSKEPSTVELTCSSGTFQDLILYFREEDNSREKLQSSVNFSRIPYEISSEFQAKTCLHKSFVKISGVEVGSGSGATTALAQEAAASNAIDHLSKQCYTILVTNPFVVERKIERHEVVDCPPSTSTDADVVADDKASRMMKMMGWGGGGLGKEEQGRTEPVLPVHQSRRAGVGSTVGQIKFNNLKAILQEFIQSGSTHDIVFSTDFDSAERKEMHAVANRFGLKSQSRSKGDNRFLVVSRKWMPKVLLSVLKDDRKKSEKYKLIPPNAGTF